MTKKVESRNSLYAAYWILTVGAVLDSWFRYSTPRWIAAWIIPTVCYFITCMYVALALDHRRTSPLNTRRLIWPITRVVVIIGVTIAGRFQHPTSAGSAVVLFCAGLLTAEVGFLFVEPAPKKIKAN